MMTLNLQTSAGLLRDQSEDRFASENEVPCGNTRGNLMGGVGHLFVAHQLFFVNHD